MIDGDSVFKALADSTRRLLLDRLFARDGLTLTELEAQVEMTRFGVMKHLRVLEEAGLVVTRKSGREKLHFLNPVPVRLIHDRWIDKYTERQVSALVDLKAELEDGNMVTTTSVTSVTTQVYQVYIRANAQQIWDAITKPEWTEKYGYGGIADFDLRPGGAYRARPNEAMIKASAEMGFPCPDVITDGEVVESDPPRRLVQTWRLLMDPEIGAEGFTRLSYEITDTGNGVCKLVVTHELDGAPKLAELVRGAGESQGAGGGWSWILSDLKTLLETGTSFTS